MQIQPWTKILGMFNTQTNYTGLPDVRAHHMLFERFSDISVTVFVLNVQPDISEWIV